MPGRRVKGAAQYRDCVRILAECESAPPDAPTSNGASTPHSNQTKGGRTS